MFLLSPIKVMQFYRAIFNSHYFPASGISEAVMILGVVQDCEKTGFCSNVFLSIFCYGKTDVGETCCRICLESLTSEMPGPARC